MIVIALVIALLLSLVLVNVLEYYESTQAIQSTSTTTFTVSNETSFATPFETVIEKGYFDSIGEVYVYLYSPYASDFVTLDVWMCRDNSSWVSVPFLNFTTENYTQMADLGVIELSNPNLTIYQKYYFPPQAPNLPANVAKQDALNSVHSYVTVHRLATPTDRTNWFSTFLTIFGVVFAVVFGIVGYFLPSPEPSSEPSHQRREMIERALVNELSTIRKALSDAVKKGENRIPDQQYPFITATYDSTKTELTSFLKPDSLIKIQRAYEEIKKLNSEGRGHLVIAGSLDHIFQFTDFNKLIALIDDSIAQLEQ